MSQQPYARPGSGSEGQTQSVQQQLANVPWYRRNATASALLVIWLGAYLPLWIVGGSVLRLVSAVPLLLVCVIVLTGEVYFNTVNAQGRLKKWSPGNKVVAALIMSVWIGSVLT